MLSVRLFTTNGSVEIGYIPTTDGYGNAEVDVTIMINHGRQFLVLNAAEMDELLFAVYRWYHYRRIGDQQRSVHGYHNHINGECVVSQNDGDDFSITFTCNEGTIQTLTNLKYEDIHKIHELRWIIQSRIEFYQIMGREIVDEIEKFADKYRSEPQRILRDASNYLCDGVLVEIAMNFFKFFADFINEKMNSANDAAA